MSDRRLLLAIWGGALAGAVIMYVAGEIDRWRARRATRRVLEGLKLSGMGAAVRSEREAAEKAMRQ